MRKLFDKTGQLMMLEIRMARKGNKPLVWYFCDSLSGVITTRQVSTEGDGWSRAIMSPPHPGRTES